MYSDYPSLGTHIQEINLRDYLELGCGDGGFLKYVLDQNKSFKSITAVDINSESIKKARTTLQTFKVFFIVQENLPLGLESDQFDTITLSNTLHHLRDKPSVLAELKRLIKPNGKIIITEMITNNLTSAEQSYCRYHALRAEVDRLHGVFHETTYTSAEIQRMVSESRLRIVKKAVLLNVKEAVLDTGEISEMESKVNELIQSVSETPEYSSLDEKARSIKAHLHQYGIKRPRQLYLETTI